MNTKTEIIEEIKKEFSYLTELGYSFKSYDAGPEFGINYSAPKINRYIHILMWVHFGSKMEIYISRNYPRYFPFFYREPNKKIFLSVNEEFSDDPDYSIFPKEMNKGIEVAVIKGYSNFLRQKMSNIISGHEWIE